MNLKSFYIENNGPLRMLNVDIQVRKDGTPMPLILVGGNGSGKTNFLSLVADALFEAAAVHYMDVVNGTGTAHRAWFRLLGASTISAGCAGSCAILQFQHDGATHFYKEKAGIFPAADVSQRAPDSFKLVVNWADEGSVKEFPLSDEQSRKIFETGVYLYFPSSRAEIPHWLNRESLPADQFDTAPRFSKRLRKPIYVERGLDQLKQWMLSVLVDVRVDVQVKINQSNVPVLVGIGDLNHALRNQATWDCLNAVLRTILDSSTARFVWQGRFGNGLLGFVRSNDEPSLPLEALSAGQATLLNIFGTLLRYGDGTTGTSPLPSEISGICLIDEVDAHMHIDLQHRALPELINMFPKMQFILSSHSPFFVLGAEYVFGSENLFVVAMPEGRPIQAEAYSEFERALQVFRDTKAFNSAVFEDATRAESRLLVFLEGETDPEYLSCAAEILGRQDIIDKVDFQWIGSKDRRGQAFNTGKDALNSAAKFLRAQPELTKRPMLLLYDNDINKENESYGHVHIKAMTSNPDNKIVTAGIENLLPESVFTEDVYDHKEDRKPNGTVTSTKALNKMRLCRKLCHEKDSGVFTKFNAPLDMVASLLGSMLLQIDASESTTGKVPDVSDGT
jgi:hypothetical protein